MVWSVWRYRLGVRTEPSQGSNSGSIPDTATSLTVVSETCVSETSSEPGTTARFGETSVRLALKTR